MLIFIAAETKFDVVNFKFGRTDISYISYSAYLLCIVLYGCHFCGSLAAYMPPEVFGTTR